MDNKPKSAAQSEIDEYTDAKRKADKEKLLGSIFEDSVLEPANTAEAESDRKLRVEQGTEYYKHLEEMSTRGSDFNDYDKNLVESAHEEAIIDNESLDAYDEARADNEALKLADIESKIKAEPKFRRLLMMAVDLADLRNKKLAEGDNPEKHAARTNDKEAKFTELFDWYNSQGMDEKVLEYILDKAFKINAGEEVTDEISINPEEEVKPERAFSLGQDIKVQRSSGAVESGWKVTNFYVDASGEIYYEVSDDGKKLSKMLSEEMLLGMQYMPETAPEGVQEGEQSEEPESDDKPEAAATDVIAGEPGSEGEALEGESKKEYEDRMAGGAPEKEDSKLELKVGDKVRFVGFKDKAGNVLEGKVLKVIHIFNEDYFVYKIETTDGEVVTATYAEIIAAEGAGDANGTGEEENGRKLEDIVFPDGGGGNGGNPEAVKGSELGFGNYPELYAQRKNLASNKKGQERLEAEGKKVAENIGDHVFAKVADFIEHNPDASEEQIKQAAMGFYLEAQNSLEREIIDHIDGVKVDGQEAKGLKGRLRKFGAWMDRHGKKIKTGLLIAGGVGLAATGVGAATGAITVGFALGAGTVLGAAKGATAGALWQRHGSKSSASREVDFSNSEEVKDIITKLNPEDRQTFDAVSGWLLSQYDSAADKDHSKNVKKTATAAVVGGALGAIAGSLQVETSTSHDVTTTEQIPNAAPEAVSHQIAPGELTGQVLDKLLADNQVDLGQFLESHNITGYGDSFTLPDGSTNIALIHAVENTFGSDFGVIGQTHSFAGADALSDDGIRTIFEAIHSNADWGSTATSTTTTISGSEVNWPWTVVAAGSASLVGDGVTKLIGDSVGRRRAVA